MPKGFSHKTNEELLREAQARIDAATKELGKPKDLYYSFYNLPIPSNSKSDNDQTQTPEVDNQH